jgi:CRISPR-associated protein Csx10
MGRWFGEQNSFDAELFQQLRCRNAYPASSNDTWVHPLPATALSPKGSKAIYDSLVERVCWERQQPVALIYAPTDWDGRPWDAAERGFYTLGKNRYDRRSVQQRILTRVSINRRRETAEDGRLYSPLAISEVSNGQSTQFLGSLIYPDGSQSRVESALREITHLGGRQTTGLGAVEIKPEIAAEVDSVDHLRQRIDLLTELFKKQSTLYTELGGTSWEIPEHTIFTVNLLSDAILLEQGWVPTNELSATQLEELTGIKAKLIRSFANTSTVGGWNVSWQRPKPTDVAVTMGSTFVFQADTALDSAAYERLNQLQLDGVGERRSEGYGQIRICDEFHTRRIGSEDHDERD